MMMMMMMMMTTFLMTMIMTVVLMTASPAMAMPVKLTPMIVEMMVLLRAQRAGNMRERSECNVSSIDIFI